MELQDHFRPPLSLRRRGFSFLSAWTTYLSSDLNRDLPEGYFAEANVQFGIEIDVAAFQDRGPTSEAASPPHADGRHAATAVWTAPAPALSVPLTLLDERVEVLVFGQQGGPTLAGAIELVSPANKDRPAAREAFVSKCAAFLQQGVGLVVVDIVTDRKADLHRELLARVSPATGAGTEAPYAASYRPVRHNSDSELEIWREDLRLGRPLPVLPLWLPGNLCIPVDLAATYDRTCREQRIPGTV